MAKQTALITGASSGFGLLAAIELAKAGVAVVAGVKERDEIDLVIGEAGKHNVSERIDVVKLDVTIPEEVESVKEYVLSTYSSLDFLINNAGISIGGAAEDVSMEAYRLQFETNVFGAIAVTKAFVPTMRNNRKGKIINMGSFSGSFAFPGLTPYAASKYALRGFSESLRLELLPFQVYVSLIEPGSYKTGIWDKGLKEMNLDVHDDYKKMMLMAQQGSTLAKTSGGDPIEVASLIKRICFEPKPKFYYPIGRGIKTMLFLKQVLPWSFLEAVITKKSS
ncbi:SDR family oxidoreductase [Paenibacillus sp.]|uniref:SDR family oxidoreductase n=1 Tax=Paenibacillus sp. TaxID=58172 RepID=UPI002D30D680|nr:SDR family oxidoreductase [Paenibacillus sp.]HZG88169.1 SDR family oxidoreductase [Paenibacillus sp.]